MRYAFVDTQRDSYPLGLLCQMLEVSRSGYADWRARGKNAPSDEEHRLTADTRGPCAKSGHLCFAAGHANAARAAEVAVRDRLVPV